MFYYNLSLFFLFMRMGREVRNVFLSIDLKFSYFLKLDLYAAKFGDPAVKWQNKFGDYAVKWQNKFWDSVFLTEIVGLDDFVR